jgi:hypothetical protein
MLISYGEDMSAACRNSRWRTATRLLSAIVYSFYSHLPCISTGWGRSMLRWHWPLSMPYAQSP